MLRWLLLSWVLLIALVSTPRFVGAEPAQDANPAPSVRRGTEVVEPTGAGQARLGVVSDAPRFAGELPVVPKLPAGFNSHDGGWIRFEYPVNVRNFVQPLIEEADAVRAELRERLGQPVLSHALVRVGRTPAEMASLAPNDSVPRYAAGVAYSQLDLVLLTIQPVHPTDDHDLREVFIHELAHLALADAVDDHAVPRWFNEGFAVHASRESALMRVRALWTAALSDTLIPLERLDRSFPDDAVGVELAYAQAADVVRFMLRQQDSQRFLGLIARTRSGGRFEKSMADAYGVDLVTVEREWREDVKRRFTFWPVFFSGSLIWVMALGLLGWSWRVRNARARLVLERWAKEEALEDAIRARLAAEKVAAQGPLLAELRLAPNEQGQGGESPVHVVIARTARPTLDAMGPDREVPKIAHNGRWHTLH